MLTSRNQVLNNEERVQDELTWYLQCHQPEVKPLVWWRGQQKIFPFYHVLLKSTYRFVPPALHQGEYLVLATLSIQNIYTQYCNLNSEA